MTLLNVSMTTVAIHQPQYIPWLPYVAKAAASDIFVYLDNVQYQKNGVQNRNQIKTAQGPAWLTVPVHASLETTIQQTPIDNTQHWRQKHLRSINMAYARAPFKQLIDQGLRALIETEWTYLADLNIALSEWIFKRLGVTCTRVRASELSVNGSRNDLVLAICQEVGATVYLSGQGAKAYQDERLFDKNGIDLHYQDYQFKEYPQCFPKTGFDRALSTVDLILNAGDKARDYL
ncbi:MAG: WbqC family protein [Betaproteobacteria bacterium]|nr:WbqC family protein [Betaproteobacteria bacterium]